MANANNPFGFELIKDAGKEARVSYYDKAAAEISRGDALTLTAAGVVTPAAAGEVLIGVAAEYKAAASTDKIAVYDDPESEFMAQVSGSFALADVGLNVDISVAAGDSLKQSNHQLDTATNAVTATLQFTYLGLMSKGENAVGANAIVRVKPNSHRFKAGVVGL